MITVPRSARVALAGFVATATVASGVALLTAAPAQAGAATDITIVPVYPTDRSAAAGTCQIYRAIATDFNGFGTNAELIDLTVSEKPSSDSQDVDFCNAPPAPDGQSGVEPTRATYDEDFTRGYTPGPSITAVGGRPANAEDTDRPDVSSTTPSTGSPTTFNSTGEDYASVNIPGGRFVEFGVVGLVPGTIEINARINRNPSFVNAAPLTVTITAGGRPSTAAAFNAVTRLDTERVQYPAVQAPSTPAAIDMTLFNQSSDTVFGVVPNYRVQSGPNATDTIQSCPASDNFGLSKCTYTGVVPGTDTLLFWVNHSAAPGSIATPGPDAGEPTRTIQVTTYAASAPAASAKFIDLTPNSPATQEAGKSATYTATITDGTGAPVNGAQVTFDETGPGRISGGTTSDGVNSTRTLATGPDGRVQISNVALLGEAGTQTITARLSGTSQCSTSGGVCQDSTTNTISAAASPSPSATRSGTPSATPSASRSATPTATVSPSRSASQSPGACQTATVRANNRTINATGLASVTVTGARPNTNVELQGYSQNHFGTATFDNDPTPVDRSGVADANGSITFSDLRPASNTRLRARMTGCTYSGQTDVIEVRAQETLEVRRTGTRSYTFSGRSIPAREGGLIVSLYRIVGSPCAAGVEPRSCPGEVFVGQARAVSLGSPGEGLYSIRITFPARDNNVRDEFVVKTGRDAQNAPGRSNARSLLIF